MSIENGPTQELAKMSLTTCTICGNDRDVKHCSRCRGAAYCSRECQGKDWHLHKVLCKSFTGFLQTNPLVSKESSAEKYVLGILYPEKEKNPRLHWVPIEFVPASDGNKTFARYQKESYFGKGVLHTIQVWVNPRSSDTLRSTIILYCRDWFMHDGSIPNKALATTTKGQHAHDWRGPLLVTRIEGLGLEGTFCNLDLQDFRQITDYFLTYGSSKSKQELFDEEKMRTEQSADKLPAKGMEELSIDHNDTPKTKIEGVKIEATDSTGGSTKYTAVALDSDHEIFWSGNSRVSRSEIAARIGLPLRILRYPVTADSVSTANFAATKLHVNTDSESNEFGWAPADWNLVDVGPILVVREDRERITPRQMEIVCKFCEKWMCDLFGHSMGNWYPEEPKSREYVLNAMTREKFEQFFIGYRTAKGWSAFNRDTYDCRNPYTGLEL